jgi:hypothetical protein
MKRSASITDLGEQAVKRHENVRKHAIPLQAEKIRNKSSLIGHSDFEAVPI